MRGARPEDRGAISETVWVILDTQDKKVGLAHEVKGCWEWLDQTNNGKLERTGRKFDLERPGHTKRRALRWGEGVIGVAEHTYPHPKGWHLGGIPLDELTIKSMTAHLRRKKECRPKAEAKWEKRLRLKPWHHMWDVGPWEVKVKHPPQVRKREREEVRLPWDKVWDSFRGGLLTPPDMSTAHKFAHRGIFSRNRRAGDLGCSLCGRRGDQIHMAECSGLEPVFEQMTKLVEKGGDKACPGLSLAAFRLLGLVLGEGGTLRMALPGNLAIIRLTLKFIWWEMYRSSEEGGGVPFSPYRCWQLILARLANRIVSRAGKGELATIKDEGAKAFSATRVSARHRLCKASHPLVSVSEEGVIDYSPALKDAFQEFEIRVPFERLNKGLEVPIAPTRGPITFVKSKG